MIGVKVFMNISNYFSWRLKNPVEYCAIQPIRPSTKLWISRKVSYSLIVFPSAIQNVKFKTTLAAILSAVLYCPKTLSLILMKEHTLQMFENMVLTIMFGPKRNVVLGGWRKLHNKELHGLNSS
jgi:hypothetical protein